MFVNVSCVPHLSLNLTWMSPKNSSLYRKKNYVKVIAVLDPAATSIGTRRYDVESLKFTIEFSWCAESCVC